jgi:1,4-alpha-glucan branching enzyme
MVEFAASDREGWRAKPADVEAICAARHPDPFAILGPHVTRAGWAIRAFVPDAVGVKAATRDGAPLADLVRRSGDFFEGLAPDAGERPAYRLEVARVDGVEICEDPYAFGPVLGPLDEHLLIEGAHRQLYLRLGAQLARHEGVDGVAFAVWAPNARRVSVVGDFNRWDGRRSQMRKRLDSGLWEIFVPGLGAGAVYKYEVLGGDGALPPRSSPTPRTSNGPTRTISSGAGSASPDAGR